MVSIEKLSLRACLIGNSKPTKHKILQNSRFQIHPGETRFPVEKHEDESGAW